LKLNYNQKLSLELEFKKGGGGRRRRRRKR
jgi:hypothetical protein